MRKRQIIEALISVEVTGDSDEECFEHFADAINDAGDRDGIRELTIVRSETKDVPFVVPPGAERWAAEAVELRFGEDRKIAPIYDGSWWWSDGHVALRCEGEGPPADFRRIEDTKWAKDFGDKYEATSFGPVVESDHNGIRTEVHISENNQVAIAAKYHRLVAGSVPNARWSVRDARSSAVAIDDSGRIVAAVMPVLFDAKKLTPKKRPSLSEGDTGPGSNSAG